MKRLLNYTTALAMTLYLVGHALALISMLASSVTESRYVLALGLSAALMMWWPLAKQLFPVAYSLVIHGRWPTTT